MKKLLSVLLTCCLLMGMTVSAAAETAPAPTVDEILNEYYQKLYESRRENSITYTRGGKTMEQEAVDELTAAGYEAYNITEENYDRLEATLKTDFSAMGIYPNASYILVVGGRYDASNQNSRVGNLPVEDFVDDTGGSFLYYYEPHGKFYELMDYTVVYEAYDDEVDVVGEFGSSFVSSLVNSGFTGHVVSNSIYTTGRELGQLRQLWGLSSAATYSASTLTAYCSVVWQRNYLLMYYEYDECWSPMTYCEKAMIDADFDGKYYNNRNYCYDTIAYDSYTVIFSPHYDDRSEMLRRAVEMLSAMSHNYDRTQEIQIKVKNLSGVYTTLLTIDEWF